MSERIKVETYKVGARKEDPAEPITPAPVRSVRGKRGSNAVKKAVRVAHEEIGYNVRSVSFTEEGLLVYVSGEPKKPFDSSESGPRGAARSRRASRRRRRRSE
jgi:hypothetical protein